MELKNFALIDFLSKTPHYQDALCTSIWDQQKNVIPKISLIKASLFQGLTVHNYLVNGKT